MKKLINLGVENLFNLQEKKRVRLTNIISIFFTCLALFYIIFFAALGFYNYVYFLFVILLGYAIPLYFNNKGLYNWGKASLVFWCNAGGLIFGIGFGKESGIHLVMIGFSSIPFLFYDFKQKLPILLGSGFSLIGAFIIYYNIFGPQETIDPQVGQIISGAMILT